MVIGSESRKPPLTGMPSIATEKLECNKKAARRPQESNTLKTYSRHSLSRICNSPKCSIRQIQYAPRNERPTVGHAHYYAPAIAWIGNAKLASEWHPPMRRREAIRIEPGAISSNPAVIAIPNAIMAGHATHGLCTCCSSKQNRDDGRRNNCFENHEKRDKELARLGQSPSR